MHFVHKHVNICFISCVLKILTFMDCLIYQNSFLQIPKSQSDYFSCMFFKFFCILSLMFHKSMFLKVKTTCKQFQKMATAGTDYLVENDLEDL